MTCKIALFPLSCQLLAVRAEYFGCVRRQSLLTDEDKCVGAIDRSEDSALLASGVGERLQQCRRIPTPHDGRNAERSCESRRFLACWVGIPFAAELDRCLLLTTILPEECIN